MDALDVRIVKLEPLRVASALGFGESPEMLAWEKIFRFLREKGLWEQMERLAYYGFNNPDPTPASPNYGYEQWVVVPEEISGTEEVEIKHFQGGLYAVTGCEGIPNIFQRWKALFAWREDSPYQAGTHQWLEKWINPSTGGLSGEDMVMELYIPIVK